MSLRPTLDWASFPPEGLDGVVLGGAVAHIPDDGDGGDDDTDDDDDDGDDYVIVFVEAVGNIISGRR